jgi:hypothetical protein
MTITENKRVRHRKDREGSDWKIREQPKAFGIPVEFAPSLDLLWDGRGENGCEQPRTELRRVPSGHIESLSKTRSPKSRQQRTTFAPD